MTPADAGRPSIEIGSIIGRTFDTFGREWSLFLLLAAPAAVGSLLQAVIAPVATTAAAPEPTIESLLPAILATIVASLFGLVSAVMITVAADDLWQGRVSGVAGAMSGGLGALPRYLVVVTLLGLAFALVALVAAVVAGGALAVAGAAGGVVVVLGALVLLPLLVWTSARLSLLGPVIVLDPHGVTGTIRRAWEVTRGHALMLFVLSLGVGIVSALPLWGASLFASFVPDPAIAGVALAIATLVYQPLPVIAMTLAWGDLVGGRHADSEAMARGRGRGTAALLVFGLGAVLLVIGIGVAAQYSTGATPAFP